MTVATAKQVAKKLKIDPDKLKQHKGAYIGMAAQMGVFVTPHIGHYRAETSVVEEDLGIKLSKEEKEWVNLGNQLLLPPDIVKKLNHIEGMGRSNVKKHALQLMMGHWIPVTAWDSFKGENDKLKTDFFAMRDEIVRDYPKLLKQVEKALYHRAKKVYERLEEKGKTPPNPSNWMDAFVKRVLGRAKSVGEVEGSFSWEIDLEWLPAPSTIEDEQLKLDKIALDRKKVQTEQAKLQSEEKVRWAVEQDQIKKMRDVNALVAEQHREKREKLAQEHDKFAVDVELKLREALLGTATEILNSMDRNDGRLLQGSVTKLEKQLKRGRMLNFMKDDEIEAYYQEIEHQLTRRSGKRTRGRNIKGIMKRIEEKMTPSVRALEGTSTKEEELCRIIANGIGDVRSVD